MVSGCSTNQIWSELADIFTLLDLAEGDYGVADVLSPQWEGMALCGRALTVELVR